VLILQRQPLSTIMASLLVASVLFLLSSGTLATITVSDFIIDSTPFAGPFTANMSISDDLTIRLDFSTIGANPDNIIAVGPGSFSDGDTATRDFYASVEFHNSGPISEIWLGDWEMEGGLELDEGVTATVDVGAKLLGSVGFYLPLAVGNPKTKDKEEKEKRRRRNQTSLLHSMLSLSRCSIPLLGVYFPPPTRHPHPLSTALSRPYKTHLHQATARALTRGNALSRYLLSAYTLRST